MTTPRQRFITKDQLSTPFQERLTSTHQPGDEVWMWISQGKHVVGIVQGVTFCNQFMVTYDIAVKVEDTDLYLVTYGLRGGLTKPGADYPGDDDGMSKPEDTPYTSNRMHH